VGFSYTMTIVDTADVTTTVSFPATGAETAADVTAAMATGFTAITGVTVSDDTTTVGVVQDVATDNYVLNGITGFTTVNTVTETPAALVPAVQLVDDDWYFITSNDHSNDFINDATTGMAFTIESLEKLYFVSSQAADNITTFTGVATSTTDVLGKLKEDQRFRSAGLFHHTADTTFPECNYISRFAPKNPGETTWTQKNIEVSISQDPDNAGVALNATQLGNLVDRSANLVQSQGGVAVVRTGVTAGGERIEIMRFRDFLVARITEAYQLKAINTEKIPYTDSGINGQRSVLESVLNRYITTADQPKGLQEAPAYNTTFPRRKDVSQSDLLSGTLNASFEAFLSGAILITNISGSLSFEDLTV